MARFSVFISPELFRTSSGREKFKAASGRRCCSVGIEVQSGAGILFEGSGRRFISVLRHQCLPAEPGG